MTTEQKQRIEYMRSKGVSYAAIAATLDLSANTVKSYCRRNNIGFTPNGEQGKIADTCTNCDSPLSHTPGSKPKRFCSDAYRMAWWKAHPEAVNRMAIYHFVCPVCGTAFEAYGNANRKYCSRDCFNTARRVSV